MPYKTASNEKPANSKNGAKTIKKTSPTFAEFRHSRCLLTSQVRKRKIRNKACSTLQEIKRDCKRKSLANILVECCLMPRTHESYNFVTKTVTQVIDQLVSRRGVKRTFGDLLSEETKNKYSEEMRIPDWQNLLL